MKVKITKETPYKEKWFAWYPVECYEPIEEGVMPVKYIVRLEYVNKVSRNQDLLRPGAQCSRYELLPPNQGE